MHLWHSTWPSGQAARLTGGSHEGPAEPLASPPLLPPSEASCACLQRQPAARHPGPAASRSRRIPVPQHPGPTGTARHMSEPFPWSQFSLKPQITRPPDRGQGSGRFEGTDLGTTEESRALTKSSGLSPAPRTLQPRTDPRLGSDPGWLPGARPGHSLLPGTLGTKAKHRPSPWPLRGEAALVLPARAAVPAGSWGRPRCLSGSTSIRPPAAALLCSFQGDKNGAGGGDLSIIIILIYSGGLWFLQPGGSEPAFAPLLLPRCSGAGCGRPQQPGVRPGARLPAAPGRQRRPGPLLPGRNGEAVPSPRGKDYLRGRKEPVIFSTPVIGGLPGASGGPRAR